jgi:predicted kinase
MIPPVRQERHASIILGPPASGKSGFANPIAQRNGAAVIDADEAKAVLPEFDGGIGANAVHRESSELAARMRETAIENGDNIVLPKTGAKREQIELIMDELAAEGYTVDLVLVNVHGDEAYRRMIQRFISSGRLVHPAYVRGMGLKPLDTFNKMKSKARRYAEIDNNGPFSAEKPLLQVSADDPLEGVNIRLRRGGVGGGEEVGGADAGKARSATETTAQGEQELIPGVEPVTPRQQAEAAMSRPLEGGDAAPDFGLFDAGAARQGDIADLIPTGIAADAEGNISPTFSTRGELLDDVTPEERAFERLKDCV